MRILATANTHGILGVYESWRRLTAESAGLISRL